MRCQKLRILWKLFFLFFNFLEFFFFNWSIVDLPYCISFRYTAPVYVCCCCYSVAKSRLTLCDPMDCSTPGLPVPHSLPEFAQVHVHWIGDAIQPSHPLLLSSPAFNLSQHQGLFQWIGSLHQVAIWSFSSVQSLSHVWLFATPWTEARQASLSITNSRSPPKPMSIVSVMPSNHLILCCPLLLLPSIFPSIRVFSNESALCIR